MDKDRLVQTFIDLVRIPSPGLREGAVAAYIKGKVASLGLEIAEDDAGRKLGGETGNLVVTVPGKARASKPRLLFAAHMDTVGPCEGVEPKVDNGRVHSAGDTILGADDKAGVAALLDVLADSSKDDELPVPVQVVFTIAEETGLLGAKNLDFSLVSADMAYVLDGESVPGDATTQAPSHIGYTVVCKGVAAHAGVAPERGVNAIRIAGEAIAELRLGRLDDETTANVGIIKGGVATNVVPEQVEVRGEARSHNATKLREAVDQARDAFESAAKRLGGSIEFREQIEYETYKVGDDQPIVKRLKAAASSLGLETSLHSSGGGSDANIFAAKGLPSIVLGMGADDVHTKNESISIDDLVKTARLVQSIIEVDTGQ